MSSAELQDKWRRAELSGVSLELFLDRTRAHSITPLDLDPDEVARELQ